MAINPLFNYHNYPEILLSLPTRLFSLLKKIPKKTNTLAAEPEFDYYRIGPAEEVQNLISLQAELTETRRYLEEKKNLFKHSLNFNINLPAALVHTAYLPENSLYLLVQNAIRYNVFPIEEPLFISINYNNLNQTIAVWYNKKNSGMAGFLPTNGIELLDLRYKLISGGNLTIRETENFYCVEIMPLFK